MTLKQHDLGQVYAQYLNAENEKNRLERYDGKENFYHASGSGTCSRKLYFQSVAKVEPTNPPNAKSMRVMRLGTILHEDIQNSLILYNNNNNNINNNNTSELTLSVLEKSFVIEGEIIIEELNVRGFFDLLQVPNSEGEDRGGFFLYDIKTAADYSYKRLTGTGKSYKMNHHELQLATYGYAIKEKYGELDGMYLMYYNKNNSELLYIEVPLTMLNTAYMFWANVNKEHSKGLPPLQDGVSPVMKWECNYCAFLDHCKK